MGCLNEDNLSRHDKLCLTHIISALKWGLRFRVSQGMESPEQNKAELVELYLILSSFPRPISAWGRFLFPLNPLPNLNCNLRRHLQCNLHNSNCSFTCHPILMLNQQKLQFTRLPLSKTATTGILEIILLDILKLGFLFKTT